MHRFNSVQPKATMTMDYDVIVRYLKYGLSYVVLRGNKVRANVILSVTSDNADQRKRYLTLMLESVF